MEYWPDGDPLKPGVLVEVREFAPDNNDEYVRVPSQAATGYTSLGAATCVGSAIVKNRAGTAKWFAGTPGAVYQSDGAGGWTDRSGGTSFAATTWDFCSFADNTIAANGASLLHVATTGAFSAIAGSPTGAKIIYVHKNAVVALGSTADPAAWARSVTGDHTNWTAAANNDADSGSLYGGIGGPIVAGCSFGNLAIAWKGAAMYAGVYVGNADPDAEVLKWEVVSDKYGCVAQFAHIETEVGLVFVSQRDIMLFNGGRPTSIADKIRKTWLKDAAGNRSRIFLTLDEANNHVYFWYSSSGASVCNRAMIWNYKTGKWGRISDIDEGATSGGDARTPVRNANYHDFISLGGSTNSAEIANLYFDIVARPLNHAGSTYASSTGLMRTGFRGNPNSDTQVARVYAIAGHADGVAGSAAGSAILYTYKLNRGTLQKTESASALTDGLYWDVEGSGRWHQVEYEAAPAVGKTRIKELLFEMQEVALPKGRSLA